MPSLPHPYSVSSSFDQSVEDKYDEMVFKRVRDDGISKKDKLKTDSRRTRVAAIPLRSVVDGKIVMQIKGRAAAAASGRTSLHERVDQVEEDGYEHTRAFPVQVSRTRHLPVLRHAFHAVIDLPFFTRLPHSYLP